MLPPIFNLIILSDLIKLKPLKKQGELKGREPLADPPVKRPQDKHGDGENTEYIFVERIIPFSDGMLPPRGHSFLHRSPAPYPGEHDSCKPGSQRADVDGHKVHPLGDDPLDTQGDCRSHRRNDNDSLCPSKLQVVLERGHRWGREMNSRPGPRSESTAPVVAMAGMMTRAASMAAQVSQIATVMAELTVSSLSDK